MSVTPILLLIFNRPDETRSVIDSLRVVKPPVLLVAADGPRTIEDVASCNATRELVRTIDWPCQVLLNFSQANLGLRRRIESAITWALEVSGRVIVLEDDCVADPTFFDYCDTLLEYYADDKRIMAISGDNFQFGQSPVEHSYYFSKYPHCWGWATWKRAWQLYDTDMWLWPHLKAVSWLFDACGDPSEARYWTQVFTATHAGQVDSWAYRWTYSCWVNSGFTILPRHNLVSNIGFGGAATHTQAASPLANMATAPLEFPLRHPPAMLRHIMADNFYARRCLPAPGLSY